MTKVRTSFTKGQLPFGPIERRRHTADPSVPHQPFLEDFYWEDLPTLEYHSADPARDEMFRQLELIERRQRLLNWFEHPGGGAER